MSEHRQRTYRVCSAFMGGLVASGVGHVVICPGSRSTPLAISARRAGVRCWVQLDERSAGFFAIGLARASASPVAVVTTSGTAAANLLPAVVEANHGGHPVIVCTADRPPELRGWGAGQTVDQVALFGTNVRWYHELAVASEARPAHAERVAARAVAEATGTRPGPVQLNWPFREPLEPPPGGSEVAAGPGPPVVVTGPRQAGGAAAMLAELARRHENGVVVAGPDDLAFSDVEALSGFAAAAGWPVLADPASQLRCGPHVGVTPVVSTADLLLGAGPFAADHAAEVIVRVGGAPTSKPYRLWVEATRPSELVLVSPGVEWADPTDSFSLVVDADPGPLFRAAAALTEVRIGSEWLDQWQRADRLADECRSALGGFSEITVARMLGEELPGGATLMVSSSMPIRDLDIGLPARLGSLSIHANRGANGIDGVTSTAVGLAAASEAPVVLFTGDIALLHDLSGLVSRRRLDLPLVIVVIDNAGGGIFSFLPIASHGDDGFFEELFTTPPRVPMQDVATLGGLRYQPVRTPEEMRAALVAALAEPASTLISAQIPIAANREAFSRLRADVASALARQ